MYSPSKLPDLSPQPVEREAKTFSPDLKGLIAWLETQDGATEYPYWNCHGLCLLSQFAKACGVDSYVMLLGGLEAVQRFERLASQTPWTFGAALSRARRALTECAGQP